MIAAPSYGSSQLPIIDGRVAFTGRLGNNVNIEIARDY